MKANRTRRRIFPCLLSLAISVFLAGCRSVVLLNPAGRIGQEEKNERKILRTGLRSGCMEAPWMPHSGWCRSASSSLWPVFPGLCHISWIRTIRSKRMISTSTSRPCRWTGNGCSSTRITMSLPSMSWRSRLKRQARGERCYHEHECQCDDGRDAEPRITFEPAKPYDGHRRNQQPGQYRKDPVRVLYKRSRFGRRRYFSECRGLIRDGFGRLKKTNSTS